eukprot:CAMPEP_0181124836 /NCGR_PEP_ID=MMETSP1071-20121207/26708_1 /TAXON_ID=35127 /ORGANISM="Thalassiosira sp., Strain NH16" /LENGTH=604 /DNA_ID=CAMNT_0023210197 /DNA_START=131 /DNA_END=1945 /DNA_ORIENTATION=-
MNLIYASTILIGAVAAERPVGSSPENNASSGLRMRRPERQRRERKTQGLFDGFGGDGDWWGFGDDSAAGDSQTSGFLDGAFDMIFGGDGDGSDGDGDSQTQTLASFLGGDDEQATSFLGVEVDTGDLCTDACTDPKVCASFVSLAAMYDPTSVFEDACNAGCVPEAKLSHCDVVCGGAGETEIDFETDAAVGAAIARAGFVDVQAARDSLCGDCKFYRCCVDPQDATVQDSSTTKYGACKAHLDDNLQHQAIGDSLLEEVFGSLAETLDAIVDNVAEVLDNVADVMEDIDVPSLQWENSTAVADTVAEVLDAVDVSGALDAISDFQWDGSEFQEWIDGIDWTDIAQDLGISDMMQNLQTMFDEALAMQDSLTVTCSPDTCPIPGLCEMDVNFAAIDSDEYCNESVFFECGDGLEDMCATKCSNDDGASDGIIVASFCSLCDVATCCKNSKDSGKSFQDCTSGVLSGDVATVTVAGEDSNGSAVDAPPTDDIQDTPSASTGTIAGEDLNGGAVDAPTVDDIQDTLSDIPATEGALAESIEGSTTAASAEEDAPSEPDDGPAVPFDFESDFAEVSRASVPESGSRAICVSATLALASVGVFFLTSI